MSTVDEVIARANAILPHRAALDGELDLRWQAIIGVGEFVESDPVPVWEFALCWGSSPDEDLRTAVAVCLVEHLLEYHFATIFPLIAAAGRLDPLVADTFCRCSQFGQSEEPVNAAQFEALQAEFLGRAV